MNNQEERIDSRKTPEAGSPSGVENARALEGLGAKEPRAAAARIAPSGLGPCPTPPRLMLGPEAMSAEDRVHVERCEKCQDYSRRARVRQMNNPALLAAAKVEQPVWHWKAAAIVLGAVAVGSLWLMWRHAAQGPVAADKAPPSGVGVLAAAPNAPQPRQDFEVALAAMVGGANPARLKQLKEADASLQQLAAPAKPELREELRRAPLELLAHVPTCTAALQRKRVEMASRVPTPILVTLAQNELGMVKALGRCRQVLSLADARLEMAARVKPDVLERLAADEEELATVLGRSSFMRLLSVRLAMVDLLADEDPDELLRLSRSQVELAPIHGPKTVTMARQDLQLLRARYQAKVAARLVDAGRGMGR